MPRRLTMALLVPLLLALSGCLKLDAAFVIHNEKLVDVNTDFGMKKGSGVSSGEEVCASARKAPGLSQGPFSFTPYEKDDWVGCKVRGIASANAEGNGFTLHKQPNGTWLFRVDKSIVDDGKTRTDAGMFTEFRVAVTFPGTVLTHNGSSTVAGTTVTWTKADDLYSTGLEATAEDAKPSPTSPSPTATSASGSAGGSSTSRGITANPWLLGGAAACGVLVVAGVVALLRRR